MSWKVCNLEASEKSFIKIQGFETILQEIGHKDELHHSFQKLFPSSPSDNKVDDMLVLTKAYNNYKRKYVKHLTFKPKEENLGKVIPIDKWIRVKCFQLQW